MGATHEGFTIHELEELSGFDRRTIAYYTQEGLLPKVGRRGRGTVYPAAFKERLMFIRAVRDLQDSGSLRAVTLAEIKDLMADMSTQAILELKTTDDPKENIRALFLDPDWDTREIAVPVEEVMREDKLGHSQSAGARSNRRHGSSSSTPSATLSRRDPSMSSLSIKQLILEIEAAVENSETSGDDSGVAVTRLSTVKLSEHITLGVEGLSEDQLALLQVLAAKLKGES